MTLSLKEALTILGIKDVFDHPPKLKFIQKRFYQLSLIHHPDRPGGNNKIYQPITEAYRFIGEYIQKNYKDEDDPEELFARQAYKSFNFGNIRENLFSFTILIEKWSLHSLGYCPHFPLWSTCGQKNQWQTLET